MSPLLVRRVVEPHVLELSADDSTLAPLVDAFYHSAPATTLTPTLRYRIARAADGLCVGAAPAQPLFGPAPAAEVFAWVEWRATDDMLHGEQTHGTPLFLHAAGVELPRGPVLILGEPGAGKSTAAAHLLAAGYHVWGDDLVRFAASSLTFSSVPRSFKLDDKSLSDIDLIRQRCKPGIPGMVLAPECWYVSPAAVRTAWEAPPGRPVALVRLSAAGQHGKARLTPMSAALAAVQATQTLLGVGEAPGTTPNEVRLIESLADVRAFEGAGGDPRSLARAIEEIAS